MSGTDGQETGLTGTVRQMIAVLEEERQALAGLDLDALVLASTAKQSLCDDVEGHGAPVVDDECRALLRTARDLNEVNRRVRNLLAANVAARIDALSGTHNSYRVAKAANF